MNDPYANKTRGAIAWMAHNPVAANLIMIILIAAGIITVRTIKQEVFPDFDLDMINVRVAYPGASPAEVEQGIILVIEENVRGLEGVDEVTSTAREGSGTVTVELLEGADPQKLYQDVQQAVERVTTFPDDAEEPQISLASRKRDVLDVAIYGDVPETVLREQAELVREQLLQSPDITQVELSGIRNHEISVTISRDALRQYNLTIDQVAKRIQSLATELPGGGIKTSRGEILVRMKERRDTGAQFSQLPIITANDGTIVTLGQIAKITDGFEETDQFAEFDGMPAILIDIYRVGDQTPISVAKAARALIDELNSSLPTNIRLAVRRDRSDHYRQRVHLLLRNGALGLCLVMLILGLFLEIRLAFWVMMGIPISFLGGMALLPFFDTSINMISMFGFLISLGIVVDDAIVVGENIYEHHQRGETFLRAATIGTREVCMPVTFSVLTNVVTFLPLMFLPGFIGKIWAVIPIVVCSVFMISLGECLFVLPAHLGHGTGKPRTRLGALIHHPQQAFSRWFVHMVRNVYGPTLDFLLRNRYAVIAIGISILVLTLGFVKSKRIGMIPMMRIEADYSAVSVALPYGAPIEQTRQVGNRLVAAAQRVAKAHGGDRLLVSTFAEYGGSFRGTSGSHIVEIRAYLTPSEIRPLSTRKFTQLWRQETGHIPGVEAMLFEADRGGPGSGASLSIELSHGNTDSLNRASQELADRLAEFPIVSDIDPGFSDGKIQLDFVMRPEGLALGLTAIDVARQVRNAFYGAEALKQQRGRNEIEVRVKLPKDERFSEADLDRLLIRTPAGTDVPIFDVAAVRRGRAYSSIERRDGKRVLNVTANVTPPSESENILSEVITTIMPDLQEKYPGLGYGFSGRQQDLREGMGALKMGFIVAVFGIYALLAIPFRSYTQPLIIMVSIPFGIVGAVWAHVLMGYPLSLMSMMGIVALAGVVVNDSLVLIDFANGERRRGANAHDAVCNAGVRRFRPILLTTLTTFLGLAPMIFETSRQARFMIPMAISLGFGILFSTLITLVLVPCLYIMIEDIHDLAAELIGNQRRSASPQAIPTPADTID